MKIRSIVTTVCIASVFIMCFVLPAAIVSAETKTFVREYTYQAGDEDSKNSSRTISLREVKRLLLEELGTYLESETEVKNFQLTKDQIVTLTAGIVGTDLIEDTWNGKTYWLKAKITANPQDITKAIDTLRRDRQKTKELEKLKNWKDESLKEIDRLRKELAKATGEKKKKDIEAYNKNIKNLDVAEWLEIGHQASTAKQWKEAIYAFSKAIELNPRSYTALYNRGYAYTELGDHKQGIADYDKAIMLNPKEALLYSMRGIAHYRLGNTKQAIIDFDKSIELDQKYALTYLVRGVANNKLGNDKQAIADYDKAIELDPKNINAYINRGIAYDKLGNDKQAIADYDKAIELDPNNREARLKRDLRGHYFFSRGNYTQAIAEFSRLIQREPNEAHYYWRGVAYHKLGNNEKAIPDFDRAIYLNSQYKQAYYVRGLAHDMLGNIKQAMADFDKAIELDLKYTQAYVARGNANQKLGNHKQAVADTEKAIKLNPKDAKAYLIRGGSYYFLGNTKQAIIDFDKSIELDQKNSNSYYMRGIAYQKNNNFKKAIADYDKAIMLNPQNAAVYYFRGDAHATLQNAKQSLSDYKIAARLGHKKAQEDLAKQGVDWNNAAIPEVISVGTVPKQPEKKSEIYNDYARPSQFIEGKDEHAINTGNRFKKIKAIVLQDGSIIEGQVISINTETVTIRAKDGKVLSYSFIKEVQAFIKE